MAKTVERSIVNVRDIFKNAPKFSTRDDSQDLVDDDTLRREKQQPNSTSPDSNFILKAKPDEQPHRAAPTPGLLSGDSGDFEFADDDFVGRVDLDAEEDLVFEDAIVPSRKDGGPSGGGGDSCFEFAVEDRVKFQRPLSLEPKATSQVSTAVDKLLPPVSPPPPPQSPLAAKLPPAPKNYPTSPPPPPPVAPPPPPSQVAILAKLPPAPKKYPQPEKPLVKPKIRAPSPEERPLSPESETSIDIPLFAEASEDCLESREETPPSPEKRPPNPVPPTPCQSIEEAPSSQQPSKVLPPYPVAQERVYETSEELPTTPKQLKEVPSRPQPAKVPPPFPVAHERIYETSEELPTTPKPLKEVPASEPPRKVIPPFPVAHERVYEIVEEVPLAPEPLEEVPPTPPPLKVIPPFPVAQEPVYEVSTLQNPFTQDPPSSESSEVFALELPSKKSKAPNTPPPKTKKPAKLHQQAKTAPRTTILRVDDSQNPPVLVAQEEICRTPVVTDTRQQKSRAPAPPIIKPALRRTPIESIGDSTDIPSVSHSPTRTVHIEDFGKYIEDEERSVKSNSNSTYRKRTPHPASTKARVAKLNQQNGSMPHRKDRRGISDAMQQQNYQYSKAAKKKAAYSEVDGSKTFTANLRGRFLKLFKTEHKKKHHRPSTVHGYTKVAVNNSSLNGETRRNLHNFSYADSKLYNKEEPRSAENTARSRPQSIVVERRSPLPMDTADDDERVMVRNTMPPRASSGSWWDMHTIGAVPSEVTSDVMFKVKESTIAPQFQAKSKDGGLRVYKKPAPSPPSFPDKLHNTHQSGPVNDSFSTDF